MSGPPPVGLGKPVPPTNRRRNWWHIAFMFAAIVFIGWVMATSNLR